MNHAAPKSRLRVVIPVAAAAILGLVTLIWGISAWNTQAAHLFLAPLLSASAILAWTRGSKRARAVLLATLAVSCLVHLGHFLHHPDVWAGSLCVANATIMLALAPRFPFPRAPRTVPSSPSRVRTVPSPERPSTPPSLTSLVLLLSKARPMNPQILRQLAGDAWGDNYSDQIDPVSASSYQLRGAHGLFRVHSLGTPYWPDPATIAPAVPDPARRSAILAHQAWIGVDLVEPPPQALANGALYAPVIRLIVELADPEDTLAIFRPETGQINLWNDDVFKLLVGPGGLDNFSKDSDPAGQRMIQDDRLMREAVSHAQSRFAEFRAAFAERRPGDLFTIKALVADSGRAECIWLHVEALHHETIEGTLANHPVDLAALQYGSLVAVRIADLHDWAYRLGTDPDGPVIGFFSLSSVRSSGSRPRFPFPDPS